MATPSESSSLSPASSSAPPSASSTASSATTPPWWAHLVIGIAVLAAGVVLYLNGGAMLGEGLVVAGVGFLGVGSGVAASA